MRFVEFNASETAYGEILAVNPAAIIMVKEFKPGQCDLYFDYDRGKVNKYLSVKVPFREVLDRITAAM